MEDILNHGSEGVPAQVGLTAPTMANGTVGTAAELCHRMVDFCQRLTAAKRKILEDPELYPEHTRHALPDSDATRLDQKMRRKKVCEKLILVPGKLDHATIAAYTVEDRRQTLKSFSGTPPVSARDAPSATCSPRLSSLALRAPCASTEDLTFRDGEGDGLDDATPTPTPSVSLGSSPSANGGGGSLAVTPVHHPQKPHSGGGKRNGESQSTSCDVKKEGE